MPWTKLRGFAFVAGTYALAAVEAVWLPAVLAMERWRQRRWQRRERGSGSWLNAREAKSFSQFGEDGMLEALFERIGTASRRFVELGAGDGHENTTRNLVEAGWSGIWVEADRPSADEAARVVGDRDVTVESVTVTPDASAGILDRAGAPAELDLLAIDLDGIDYYVWRSLGRSYRPRVVVVEYNAAATPGTWWVQPYRPGRFWDGSRRFGASLDALDELAGTLGYSIVACESHGANAFFVRDDVLAERLPGVETRVSRLYRSPKYFGDHFGHPCRRDRSGLYRREPRS
jgi:hypothetical protein